MSVIRWLMGLCIAVAIAAFAAFNREQVTVIWSPFHPPHDYPLFLPVIVFLMLGFLLGAASVWLNGVRTRREKYRLKQRVKELEKRAQEGRELQSYAVLPTLGKKG